MTDYFGKRGLSWHVAHVVRLRKCSSHSISPKSRTYDHRSFVHVFNNSTRTDRTIISIFSDVFKKLKREDAQIKKLLYEMIILTVLKVIYSNIWLLFLLLHMYM